MQKKKKKSQKPSSRPVSSTHLLREEIKFLKAIIENIPNMVFLKDAKNLRFAYLNRAGEKLLGYSEKDLLGKNDYDFFPKKEADFFTRKDREVLKKRGIIDITEEPIQTRKKGARFLHTKKCSLLNSNGKPAFLLGISEDITEKKEAEARLAESEKRLQLILQSSGIGTWSWQVQTNKVSWDKNMFYLFGINPKNSPLDYESLIKTLHPRDQGRIKKALGAAIAGGHEFNQEYTIVLPNKSEKNIAVRSLIDRNAAGEAVSMTGICWDITEQHQKHTLEVKSEMISMVSHELRTPIHTIKEGISVVLEGLAGEVSPEQHEVLDTAKRCIERLTRLINNVLDFQKMEAGIVEMDFEKQSLNEMISNLVLLKQPPFQEKKIDLKLNLCEDPLEAEIDADKITQVLTNLIHNAIKFTEKGTVTITTGRRDGQAHIAIRDTGIGFSRDDAEKLFSEFGQTERARKLFPQGTGLGLAISKKIILRHQGKIWAESKKPLGSEFHILLPLRQEIYVA